MFEVPAAPVPRRVLVVDDEPAQVRALCDVLTDRGFAVEGCAGGELALARLATQNFDLLLCDLSMPGMDGVALLHEARALAPDMPGVIMTGHASIGTAVEALRAGAVDYLVKPIRLATALPVLERALEIAALRRGKAELERVVRAQMLALQQANADLEAFAYSVSHDLRAPLHSIEGFSRLLETRHGERLGPEGQGFVRRVRNGVRQMNELVEGLLSLSRLGRTAVRRQHVDMAAMARDVAGFLRESNLHHGVPIEVDASLPAADADPTLLRQVWVNLLSNACKFSSRSPEPRVQVGWEGDATHPVYLVRDNGVGFDAGAASTLFKPFQRLHSQADYQGVGLGLSIVERIVARHGGRIWVESAPGKGACFRFVLRGEDAPTPSAEAPASGKPPAGDTPSPPGGG